MSRPRADYYKSSRSSASARLYCMVVSQCEAHDACIIHSFIHIFTRIHEGGTFREAALVEVCAREAPSGP